MTDLYVEGPDVVRLLSDLGVNTFKNFALGKAKQFVACTPDGYVIGDAILFFLAENRVRLVGRPSAHNWVQFHARDGRLRRAARAGRAHGRQPDGPPGALPLPGSGPDGARRAREGERRARCRRSSSSTWASSTIAGHPVRALHHGMSGAPGMELFGPWEEGEDVRAALVEAGADFGLRQVGSRVYATNTLESGWIPCPLPAVFTGEELKPYREWLPANGYEATGSLGGSFYSDDIADYYLTPWDLGYGPFVKFDHDFVGREALEALARAAAAAEGHARLERRGRRATRWARSSRRATPAKYIDLPLSNYSTWPNDKVLHGGDMIGVSTFSGYSYNERSLLSLAIVDAEVEYGTEVTLVWGEEDGGSAKPVVERHAQCEIRAVVSPCPYSEVARTTYAEGWRTEAAPSGA